MIEPMKFAEGLEKFKRIYAPEDVGLVIIPTSKGTGYEELMISLLRQTGISLPEDRIFEYIPPRSVGHNSSPREEIIPTLNPSLAYIIGDDGIEDGYTLDIAVKRVGEQIKSSDDIWALFSMALHKKWHSLGPYFDRAEIFKKYIQSLN